MEEYLKPDDVSQATPSPTLGHAYKGERMNVKIKIMKKISVTVIAVVMLISCMLGSTVAYASNTTLSIDANVYDLDKNSDYVLGENSPSESAAIGTLTIGGNVKTSSDVNSFPAYEVTNGNASTRVFWNAKKQNGILLMIMVRK